MLRIGRKGKRQEEGFTLLEILLSLAIIAGSLVFILGALAGLSRHLSSQTHEIQAFSLATGKILEWDEKMRNGDAPTGWERSGKFESARELNWKAEFRSLTSIHPNLYELQVKVFKEGIEKPLVALRAEGWVKPPEEKTS